MAAFHKLHTTAVTAAYTSSTRPALDALMWYLESHDELLRNRETLFCRARSHPITKIFQEDRTSYEQTFLPYSLSLEKRGHNTVQTLNPESFDLIVYPGSKNKQENLWYVAYCFMALRPGGVLIFALENTLGASSYKQLFAKHGLTVEAESKRKCRIYRLEKGNESPSPVLDSWISMANSLNRDGYFTHPAAFSWEHIDPASELLVTSLKDLTGYGADLGSGYGYLTRQCIERFPGVTGIDLYEAELHALQASRENLSEHQSVEYYWHDVQAGLPHARYDWIVMNPPYHIEKQHSLHLFESFLEQSHSALRADASVYCVSQKTIPQQHMLKKYFREVSCIGQDKRFECFRASGPLN